VDYGSLIRAQSRPTREVNLEDESQLRNLIDGLLKESPPAARPKKVKAQASASNVYRP